MADRVKRGNVADPSSHDWRAPAHGPPAERKAPVVGARAGPGSAVAYKVPIFNIARHMPGAPHDAKHNGREKFTGFAEDWPTEDTIRISEPRVAIARTQGEVGVRNSRGQGIDVHELLKREAFASPNDACDNHFEKNRPCPDSIFGLSDQYVVLDSWEKIEESDPARGIFQFNFMVQGVTRDQAIGVRDKIDTVIEMQVGAFTIQQLLTVPYVNNPTGANTALPVLTNNDGPPPTDSLATPLTQLPFSNRITLYLNEMGLQSFSDFNNGRHHFEFTATPNIFFTAGVTQVVDTGALLLTPVPEWDYYVFTDPIKDVFGLTLQFRTPDIPVSFQPDVLYGAGAQVSLAGQFLQFNWQNHGLVAGDRIFIRGFSSGNPPIDNWVNRKEGQVVASADLQPDWWRLSPDVGTAVLGPPATATGPPPALGETINSKTRIVVYIARRRFRIPLRFRRIIPRLTNYITP